MNDDVTAKRRAWIDALRSGNYVQARETLVKIEGVDNNYRAVGYCCIGVACQASGTLKLPDSDGDAGWTGDEAWDPDSEYEKFRREIAVSKQFSDHLVEMNDKRARSFPFIARFLEIAWRMS